MQDFARIVGVPLEQYTAFKTAWQAEHKKRQAEVEEQSDSSIQKAR